MVPYGISEGQCEPEVVRSQRECVPKMRDSMARAGDWKGVRCKDQVLLKEQGRGYERLFLSMNILWSTVRRPSQCPSFFP